MATLNLEVTQLRGQHEQNRDKDTSRAEVLSLCLCVEWLSLHLTPFGPLRDVVRGGGCAWSPPGLTLLCP